MILGLNFFVFYFFQIINYLNSFIYLIMEIFKKKIYEYTNIYNRKKTRQVLKYDNKNKSVRDKTPNNSAINSSNFSKIIHKRKKILDKYINKYSKNNQIIINNLKKHNSSITYYNKEKITSLIFDGKFHYVSIFKDYLFWDDNVECLKKYYKKNESILLINQFINYYSTIYNSLNIYCIYFNLGDCKDVILEYYRKKIKLQQSIIKSVNKNMKKDKNTIERNKNKIIEKLIETHTKLSSQSLNLSKFTPDELILDKINIEDISKINTIQTTTTNSKIFKSRNEGDLLLIKKENKSKEFSYDETIKLLIKNLTHNKKKSKICIYKYNGKKKNILKFQNIDKFKQILMKISSTNNRNFKNSSSLNKKMKNSLNILKVKPLSNNHSAKHLYIKTESNKILIPRNKTKKINNLKPFNIKEIILNNKNDNETCLTERNNSKWKKQKNPLGIYFDNFKKMRIKILKNANISKIYLSSKTSPKYKSKSSNKIIYFNKNLSKNTITTNNSQFNNLKFDKLKLNNFKKLSIKSKSHNKYYI